MKKLSVIIVSYNVKHYLAQCLNALLWLIRDLDAEVFVVDNHSKDGSVEHLANLFGQQINLIASNHNLGFAKANNVAIKQATGEYILLLNPDTIPTKASIHDTLAFMDAHPRAGGLGVRMLKSDGTKALESRRGIPTPMTAFYKMCGLCTRYPEHPKFGHYYMGGISWDEPQQIEVISGAFFMIRKSALDAVGLLDEDYFMYGEDIDLSYRLLDAGWENWYHPAVILHYKGESTYKSSFRYVHVFYKAMLIFFGKYYSHLSFLITLPIRCAILVRAAIAIGKIEMKEWSAALGMKNRSDSIQPSYLFIGSRYSITYCQSLARKKGLDMTFVEGTIGSLPQGHHAVELPDDRPLVVVYDVSAYSYDDIFHLFAMHPLDYVTIGLYDNNTHMIVTQTEIIYDSLH